MSRQMTLLTLAALLAWFPAAAGQPEGLAGKIVSNARAAEDPFCTPGFEWYEYFGTTELGPADTVTLDLAIIPFGSGNTGVALDEAAGGTTLAGVDFEDGLANGVLPYRRFGWNDVTVEIRFESQDYLIKVNGLQAGPFPFGGGCTVGCFSVWAFRLNESSQDGGNVAWVDSVSVTRHSAGGAELLFQYKGDPCSPDYSPEVSGGGLVIADPTERRGRGRCAGVAR